MLQPQKQAHKAITKAVAKGANVTDHHDAFFNSIAGPDGAVFWNGITHRGNTVWNTRDATQCSRSSR